jgi:hypothetical protein
VRWRRQGSRDALLIDLEPSLIARVAAEAFELDSSRTILPPLYGLNLPELRSAMLAVDAELSAGGVGGSLFGRGIRQCFGRSLDPSGYGPRQVEGSSGECTSMPQGQ